MAHALLIDQPSLEGFCRVTDAVNKLARDSGANERGAIYTQREVVAFMLDLAGHEPSRPLHRMRLLEPSFGGGEFVLEAVRRLLSASAAFAPRADLADYNYVRAVELRPTWDVLPIT